MTTYKVSELSGALLDEAVAIIERVDVVLRQHQPCTEHEFDPEGPAHEFDSKVWKMWRRYSPSTDWAQGGPIIERERIATVMLTDETSQWFAFVVCEGSLGAGNDPDYWLFEVTPSAADASGPTLLIAAMRAYVISKLGPEVDLPTAHR